MISPDELVHRARARCKHHRQPGVGGVCRECLLAEIEQAIADEHPEVRPWGGVRAGAGVNPAGIFAACVSVYVWELATRG